jgi:hypothetical protein
MHSCYKAAEHRQEMGGIVAGADVVHPYYPSR